MQMLYIWILAAVVFGVLEGITAQLVSIWFVLGAVAAAVAAACAPVFRPPTRTAALAEPAWFWKILTI